MRLCSVPGCDEKHYGAGLCKWHRGRERLGDLDSLAGPRPPRPHCAGCGKELRNFNQTRCEGCAPEPQRLDQWINPLVCVCESPQADPRVNYGECAVCRRKPLSLFRVAS